MKIAVTHENGQIFQHFGHTEQFKVYTVENGKITLTKVEGDPVGPFQVGLYLQNTETKSEAVVLSGGYAFNDTYLVMSNYANGSLLTGSVNYMT